MKKIHLLHNFSIMDASVFAKCKECGEVLWGIIDGKHQERNLCYKHGRYRAERKQDAQYERLIDRLDSKQDK